MTILSYALQDTTVTCNYNKGVEAQVDGTEGRRKSSKVVTLSISSSPGNSAEMNTNGELSDE